MSNSKGGINRRRFLRSSVVMGGSALAAAGMMGPVWANRHPHPHADSLDYLDDEYHTHMLQQHAKVEAVGLHGGKSQMWVRGRQRMLFYGSGHIVNVTDPLHPEVIANNAYRRGQIQLAYNNKLQKWILMMGHGAQTASATEKEPGGKYKFPDKVRNAFNAPGLRGVSIYDATDPTNVRLLSEWSCDQGDPSREIQTGGGTHRNYYDGGKYAYLDTAPDNSFINQESPYRVYSHAMQVIDLEDPEKPKFVSNWWFPGQRAGEQRDYHLWREHGDRTSFTTSHGPFYVPVKVENGGRYAYGSYGSFGITIHDVSNPVEPKLVGRWRPPYLPGPGIPFHTVDVSRLDRGFVITNSETLNPDCNEPYHDNYIVDVRDPTNPKKISTLPRWKPPADAPYNDFCQVRGRTGTHNPPHVKAPGRPDPDFTVYAAFNAGFQSVDISDPANPKITGYFVQPSGGDLERWGSWNRPGENVFVEWDRRLIWAGADSGVYLLSHRDLGKPVMEPRAVERWALDGLNEGHDDIA